VSGDPVSWLLIEPGWKVLAADGTEVGRVEEVVGDTEKDIFSGIAVSSGLLPGPLAKARFVPAERITFITEGEIHLDLPADAIDRLEEHEPAPAPEQVRP
jgi:sporulation protein YlmC with PRC-barrel domain